MMNESLTRRWAGRRDDRGVTQAGVWNGRVGLKLEQVLQEWL